MAAREHKSELPILEVLTVCLCQQQQQLLQHQWVHTDPDGNMEDDDYDDDVDDDAEDKDVDEVFGTPLLPPTPPFVL